MTTKTRRAKRIDPTQDLDLIHRLIGEAAVDNVGITGCMDVRGIVASATGGLIFLMSEARGIDRDASKPGTPVYSALKAEADEAIERVLDESRSRWAKVRARSAVRRGITATEAREV